MKALPPVCNFINFYLGGILEAVSHHVTRNIIGERQRSCLNDACSRRHLRVEKPHCNRRKFTSQNVINLAENRHQNEASFTGR